MWIGPSDESTATLTLACRQANGGMVPALTGPFDPGQQVQSRLCRPVRRAPRSTSKPCPHGRPVSRGYGAGKDRFSTLPRVRTLRERKGADAAARAAGLARRFGTELRIARMAAGLTQQQVGERAGVTQQLVSLAERGDPGIGLNVRCRLTAAAGQELGWKLYPAAGVSLRDSGQLHVAQAILGSISKQLIARLEVPVAAGDLRAADLLITAPTELIHVEVERSLFDLQAQLRAAQLKRDILAHDSTCPVRLIIAVPDSARVRALVAGIPEIVRAAFPVPSREVASALRRGTPLGGDGLLFVRTARPTSSGRGT